jgi:hypothetical protein
VYLHALLVAVQFLCLHFDAVFMTVLLQSSCIHVRLWFELDSLHVVVGTLAFVHSILVRAGVFKHVAVAFLCILSVAPFFSVHPPAYVHLWLLTLFSSMILAFVSYCLLCHLLGAVPCCTPVSFYSCATSSVRSLCTFEFAFMSSKLDLCSF